VRSTARKTLRNTIRNSMWRLWSKWADYLERPPSSHPIQGPPCMCLRESSEASRTGGSAGWEAAPGYPCVDSRRAYGLIAACRSMVLMRESRITELNAFKPFKSACNSSALGRRSYSSLRSPLQYQGKGSLEEAELTPPSRGYSVLKGPLFHRITLTQPRQLCVVVACLGRSSLH
jgi:hypothetical protein